MTKPFDPFDPQDGEGRPDCQAFEIAVDMRAMGELSADPSRVLEDHLASCDGCRQYAARAQRLDAALAASAPGLGRAPDWAHIQEKLRGRLRRARRAPWILAAWLVGVMVAIAGIMAALGRGSPSPRLLLESVAFVMLIVGAAHVVKVRRLRLLLDSTDLVASYRSDLERNLKSLRQSTWWMPLILGLCGLQLVTASGWTPHGPRAGRALLLMVVVGAIAMGVTLFAQWRITRRLERELAELR